MDRMIPSEDNLCKIVPFPVFQAHCDERKFVYAGRPRTFDVKCRLGSERCNHSLCPIWNSDKVKNIEPPPTKSLRDINIRLRGTRNSPKKEYWNNNFSQ